MFVQQMKYYFYRTSLPRVLTPYKTVNGDDTRRRELGERQQQQRSPASSSSPVGSIGYHDEISSLCGRPKTGSQQMQTKKRGSYILRTQGKSTRSYTLRRCFLTAEAESPPHLLLFPLRRLAMALGGGGHDGRHDTSRIARQLSGHAPAARRIQESYGWMWLYWSYLKMKPLPVQRSVFLSPCGSLPDTHSGDLSPPLRRIALGSGAHSVRG